MNIIKVYYKNIAGCFIVVEVNDEEWEEPDLLEALLRKNGFINFNQIGYGTHYDILATKNI